MGSAIPGDQQSSRRDPDKIKRSGLASADQLEPCGQFPEPSANYCPHIPAKTRVVSNCSQVTKATNQ
jgi:hypothetical protein